MVKELLYIRPATIYHHINNSFAKLQVATRQELIVVLLGTDNRDNEEPKLTLVK